MNGPGWNLPMGVSQADIDRTTYDCDDLTEAELDLLSLEGQLGEEDV